MVHAGLSLARQRPLGVRGQGELLHLSNAAVTLEAQEHDEALREDPLGPGFVRERARVVVAIERLTTEPLHVLLSERGLVLHRAPLGPEDYACTALGVPYGAVALQVSVPAGESMPTACMHLELSAGHALWCDCLCADFGLDACGHATGAYTDSPVLDGAGGPVLLMDANCDDDDSDAAMALDLLIGFRRPADVARLFEAMALAKDACESSDGSSDGDAVPEM